MKTLIRAFGFGVCLATSSYGAALLAGVDDSALADGSVDGWSGITALSVPISGGDVVTVTDFSFFASAGRADGTRSVTPLILSRPAGSELFAEASVVAIGTPVSVVAEGVNNHPFAVSMGDTTLDLTGDTEYLAGFWQWAEGVDDTDGGVVAFGADGGTGMFQRNEDGTTYVPALGDPVDAGHQSDPGGRNYQFNVESSEVIPEPSIPLLLSLGGLALIFRRRRS